MSLQIDLKTWHHNLPPKPTRFPSKTSFVLEQNEAKFIRDRIHNSCKNTLLDQLAQACDKGDILDSLSNYSLGDLLKFEFLSEQNRMLLNHAVLFSQVMNGASILYNLQLAKLSKSKLKFSDAEQHIADHEENLIIWVEELQELLAIKIDERVVF